MTVYSYIAENNPNKVVSIIESFGYEVRDNSNLGKSLQELVSNVGESALLKIMDCHPDKDILLEVNAPKKEKKESGCGCSGCSGGKAPQYLNASGSENPSTSNAMVSQTNTMLLAVALILSVAIIFKNN